MRAPKSRSRRRIVAAALLLLPLPCVTVAAEPKVPVVMAFYGTPLEEPWNMVIHTALEGEERAGKIRYTWKDNLAGMEAMGGAIRAALAAKPDMIVADAAEIGRAHV